MSLLLLLLGRCVLFPVNLLQRCVCAAAAKAAAAADVAVVAMPAAASLMLAAQTAPAAVVALGLVRAAAMYDAGLKGGLVTQACKTVQWAMTQMQLRHSVLPIVRVPTRVLCCCC